MTTMTRLSGAPGRPAPAQSRIAAAFVVLLTVLLAVAAAPAWAEPSGPPPPAPPSPGQPGSAGPAAFGVRPATATAPDTRSHFTFGATPGAILRDFLSVENISAAPLTLRVYASDAFNTPEGGFDVLAGGRKPVDVGAWTVPSQDIVTVGGRSAVIVPFTVTIPHNASPGDHAGGIVAALTTQETNAEGQQVTVEQRVGARIYLRIAGEFTAQLTIDGLTGAFRPSANPLGGGEATVRYTVRNEGNIRLRGAQKIQVKTPWGSTLEFRDVPELPELLPGNSLDFTVPVRDVLPAVWLTGLVLLDPLSISGDQNPELDSVHRSTGFAAISWVLSGILLALILVGLYAVWRRRRRRHDRGGSGKADRGPTGPMQPIDPQREAGTHAVNTDRIMALGVATLLASVTVFSGAAVAHAEPIGELIIHPGQSLDIESIRVHTSRGCPTQADAYYAMVTGYGFPPDGQVVAPNTAAGLSHSAGFDVYFQQTMKDFATANNTTLQGEYQVTVYCVDSFTLMSFGEFTGAMRFDTPTEYEAIGAAKPAVEERDPRAVVLENLPPDAANTGPTDSTDGSAPGAAPPGGVAAPDAVDPPALTSTVGSSGPGNGFPPPIVMVGVALGTVALVGALLMYLLRGRRSD